MDTTEIVLKLIKEKYKSVRQFSIAAEIPYSTVKSGLKAGIGGMAVETVIKMCDVLNVQMENVVNSDMTSKDNRQLSADEWYLVMKYRELSDKSRHEIMSYLEYRSQSETFVGNHSGQKSKA